MSQEPTRIEFLLERLIACIVIGDSDDVCAARAHAYQLIARILESRLQPSIAADENAVSEQIKRKCMSCAVYFFYLTYR